MSLSSLLLAPVYDRLLRPSEQACLASWREALVADLSGEVLDIGAGTGANLPYYSNTVTQLVAAEPDRHMRRRLRAKVGKLAERLACSVEVSDASADRLPMADGTFDAVVSTLVLCTVPSPHQALAEYRRVIKPGGTLVFIEHVAAHDNPSRLRWQHRVEPLWKRVFGNCHLTRDTASTIEAAGFEFEHIERQSMRKASPLVRPTIRGVARVKRAAVD